MKSGALLNAVALSLIITFPLIMCAYNYYILQYINVNALALRFALLLFLCSMAFLGKNWARLILGVLSVFAAIGALAALALHYYKPESNELSFFVYLQILNYLCAALLLFSKSVRDHYKKIHQQEKFVK